MPETIHIIMLWVLLTLGVLCGISAEYNYNYLSKNYLEVIGVFVGTNIFIFIPNGACIQFVVLFLFQVALNMVLHTLIVLCRRRKLQMMTTHIPFAIWQLTYIRHNLNGNFFALAHTTVCTQAKVKANQSRESWSSKKRTHMKYRVQEFIQRRFLI